jgi:two-component system, NtrC family, response regulator HydG
MSANKEIQEIEQENPVQETNETKEFREKPTVLVIDDDLKILEAFQMLMDSENCNMIAASDVQEAIKKVEGKELDLIITDFMLKTKSSVELFALIKKTHPKVPVVVMTGYPELISERDVHMFGGHYFLTKPLELGRLRRVIRSYCSPLKI